MHCNSYRDRQKTVRMAVREEAARSRNLQLYLYLTYTCSFFLQCVGYLSESGVARELRHEDIVIIAFNRKPRPVVWLSKYNISIKHGKSPHLYGIGSCPGRRPQYPRGLNFSPKPMVQPKPSSKTRNRIQISKHGLPPLFFLSQGRCRTIGRRSVENQPPLLTSPAAHASSRTP